MLSSARKAILLFSLFFLFSFFLNFPREKTRAATSSVVINEVLYDPAGADTGQEWIELYNPGPGAADLGGFELNAASGDYYRFSGMILAEKSFLLVRWATAGENSAANLYTGKAGYGNMGNSHGWVALFNSSTHSKSTLVDYLEYGEAGQTWEGAAKDAGLWSSGDFIPTAASGSSLGLKVDGQEANRSADWQVFTEPSPGRSNGTPESYPSNIYLWEYLPNPAEGNEWVEIYNDNSESKTLSNWQIDDVKDGGASPKSFSTTLPGKSFFKIDLGTATFFNNSGDKVRLLKPDGAVADETSYSETAKDISFARDNNRDWQETKKLTPGGANLIESPVHETTLAEIRKLTLGSRVSFEAFVTVPPDLLGENDFYVHDKDTGIKVHCTCELAQDFLQLGDKVKVASTVEEVYSEKYIKTNTVTVLERNRPQVAVDEIRSGEVGELQEGNLVRISGTVEDLEETAFYVNDGTGRVKIYFKDSTGVPRPKVKRDDQVSVLGLVSQYGYREDGSPNYRVLPRYTGDVEILPVIGLGGGQVLGAAVAPSLQTVKELPRTGLADDFYRWGWVFLFSSLFLRGWVGQRLLEEEFAGGKNEIGQKKEHTFAPRYFLVTPREEEKKGQKAQSQHAGGVESDRGEVN